ncbi:protein MALE DISCOVERER 2-like [Impatiens glandulifera]|uniref:protein MALE DISCOVERER 2-like n=1 Tax=Impatiens glandulifera TaxID=253017 RepID=UPI001FB1964D|nr:protein MALE DISCOVERER 2-like [Impatiens glandulifera]
MVYGEMEVRWDGRGGLRSSYCTILILLLEIQGCFSLNSEGLALLGFRAGVEYDPLGVFTNWDATDDEPCKWSGVQCFNTRVEKLDLRECSFKGIISSHLGELPHLRSLILRKNQFYGTIPREIGKLTMLEMLDLRENNLTGTIPTELRNLMSLKHLLIRDNKFEEDVLREIQELNSISDLEFPKNLTSCTHRKLRHCIWQSSLKQLKKVGSFIIPLKHTLINYSNLLRAIGRYASDMLEYNCCDNNIVGLVINQNIQVSSVALRRRLSELSNIAAAPVNGGLPKQILTVPISHSSGSYYSVPSAKGGLSSPVLDLAPSPADAPEDNNSTMERFTEYIGWRFIIAGSAVGILLLIALVIFCLCRNKAVPALVPWKNGLSGQLQKAFVTGVPKLNRGELVDACEDFSNVVSTNETFNVYKGTLSSGVEIAVISTTIISVKEWSRRSQRAYRKKIEVLTRVNHKNFVNLIGYCEEEEPFTRMMVFEYAPNGHLYEHLHVKEVEQLDWNARIRVIMGMSYCLQHMHDLKPPVTLSYLSTKSILLTDDYAAKILERCFHQASPNSGNEDDSSHHDLQSGSVDPEANVLSFGLTLLEIISGKVPYSEGQNSISNWAMEFGGGNQSTSTVIDTELKSFKDKEAEVIGEVIRECLQQEPKKRPTMKEITLKLSEVIPITPEQATPRTSPLWWAELEILSAEST